MNIHDESKIHLVSSRPERERAGCTRIEFGDLLADILRDNSHSGLIYQWVVQRRGSSEVLGLGQSYSFDHAKSQATAIMSDLLRNEKASQSGD